MTSSAASLTPDVFPGVGHPQAPLVTVVVVNYNFGRFLPDTIGSVFAQSYPRVECIVVDNASTDNSCAVVEELRTQHANLELLRREANDGQTAATIDGVAAARGVYIILLDGDDLLLPHCVETHIKVHLASRIHVGFTCGDMLQMVDNQVVLSTGAAMAGFVRSKQPQPDLLRRSDEQLAGLMGAGLDYATGPDTQNLGERLYLVPRTQIDWVWSPTSGMCFRRDALELLCDNPSAASLRSQTDLYLALGVNAISGSILIDAPVFTYRLHGSNVFSSRAQMNGRLSYDPKRTGDMRLIAHRLLIDQFVSHIDRFVQEPGQIYRFLLALIRLDVPADRASGQRGSYLAQALPKYAGDLKRAVGRFQAVVVLFIAGVSWTKIWREFRADP